MDDANSYKRSRTALILVLPKDVLMYVMANFTPHPEKKTLYFDPTLYAYRIRIYCLQAGIYLII